MVLAHESTAFVEEQQSEVKNDVICIKIKLVTRLRWMSTTLITIDFKTLIL